MIDTTKYTSPELGKWLEERGFKKKVGLNTEHNIVWLKTPSGNILMEITPLSATSIVGDKNLEIICPAYHILDLVIDHGKELFGEHKITTIKCKKCHHEKSKMLNAGQGLILNEVAMNLMNGDKDGAEEVIMEHCILKPKA